MSLGLIVILVIGLVGIAYPSILVSVFLAVALLVPKLPIIEIEGYMVPIRAEDIFLALACLLLGLRVLAFRERWVLNPLWTPMVWFSIFTAASTLFGTVVLGTVPSAKIGLLFWLRSPEYFCACALGLIVVRSEKQFRQMVIAFLIIVTVIGLYGMLQEFSYVPLFDAMHADDEIVTMRFFPGFAEERMFSTFAGPYDLAGFYLLALPITTAVMLTVRSRFYKGVLSGVLALSMVCFYLTFARVPIVAVLPTMFICLSYFGKEKILFFLTPIFIAPAFFIEGFSVRFATMLSDPMANEHLGGRMENWSEVLTQFFTSPLLGTGPASIGNAVGVDGMIPMLGGTWGLCGLVSFLYLIYRALKWLRQASATAENDLVRAVGIGTFAGTIGLLINAATLESFFNSKIAFTYWWLLGLLFAAAQFPADSPAVETAEMAPSPLVSGPGGAAPRSPSDPLPCPE